MRPLFARTAAVSVLATAGFALSALTPANAAFDPDQSCGSPAPGVTTHADNAAPVATDVTVSDVVVGQGRDIDLSSAISDPDGDVVSVVGIQNPKNGYVCQQGNDVFYNADKPGTETLRYGVTDGATYRTANLTITTRALVVKAPQVLTKAKLVKGKITKSAKVRLNNGDPEAGINVDVEKQSKNAYDESFYEIDPGQHRDFNTNYRTILVAIYPQSDEYGDDVVFFGAPAAAWRVDTVTGKVTPVKDEDFRRATARAHR